ncbi:hypothetical protein ACIQJT_35280 [Streptomyces sp. NPDC091972]|uniref:hypothetical protein n=1 Tax=Streptomyces sp. NPDC091972 TaxID=3366007 RepID=UPI0037FD5F1D
MYPELSAKYRETSCVAGILLDQDAPQYVQLHAGANGMRPGEHRRGAPSGHIIG